mmetsp:Transcript_24755/g.69954  ORF Transcript_24755/g.69954 Transcript_24755/m.69954 type:complete len:374 (+) Transcript_24755:846-1967(+)
MLWSGQRWQQRRRHRAACCGADLCQLGLRGWAASSDPWPRPHVRQDSNRYGAAHGSHSILTQEDELNGIARDGHAAIMPRRRLQCCVLMTPSIAPGPLHLRSRWRCNDARKAAIQCHQPLEAALLHDLALFQHEDLVCSAQRALAVRNDQHGLASCCQPPQRVEDDVLAVPVQRAGALVENEHARRVPAQKAARQRHALHLPCAELALVVRPQHGVIPFRKCLYELVGARSLRGDADRRVAGLEVSITDVLCDAQAAEERGRVVHDTQHVAICHARDLVEALAVHKDLPRARPKLAAKNRDCGALALAASAGQRNKPARRELERQCPQHKRIAAVGERDAIHAHGHAVRKLRHLENGVSIRRPIGGLGGSGEQ